MSGITTPYDALIRASLPRVLSQLSRDPDAPTYGCFDRNHWHLKIRDFASMVLQGSALTLALAARDEHGLVPPQYRAALADWARAACEYWAAQQHRDGTFDEYYPNERAVIPTSFSTFAVSRIYTADRSEEKPSAAVMKALVKAAWALSRRSERLALNQEAASLPAMLAVARLSGDAGLERAAGAKIERFLALQNKEGWFDERGGIDVGYLSTTLDYLCEAQRLQPRDDVLDAARRVAEVLEYFCHADGTCGGQYGSRNTEYLIPSGFEYLADQHSPSAAVCTWFRERVLAKAESFYAAFDDRYVCHNMLHAAMRAREYFIERARHGKRETSLVPVPSSGAHDKCFAEAGLWVAGDWRAQTIVALKKGGVVHGLTASGDFFGDFGYRCRGAKGELLVSSWQSDRWRVERVENGYRTTGPLCRATFTRITPLRHMALRVLAKVFGPRLIPLLQERMIMQDAPSAVTLTRTMTRDGDRLRVEDRLESPEPLVDVRPAPKYSLRHVASSMCFRDEEYALGATRGAPLPVEHVGGACVVRRTRVWDLVTGRELGGDA
ncbi:MAG: hypothetical protein JW889_12135 [Verrucomicrobia bacterium]|nr:hypothetical protein [Verrucomicrobiota bacterium]